MERPWPVVLREDVDPPAAFGTVVLRPLRRRDRDEWDALRSRNEAWLRPWEPSDPATTDPRLVSQQWARPTFGSYVHQLNRQGRQGTAVPLAVEVDGALAGQIIAGSIVYGSQRSAVIGYWVSQDLAGRAITPLAVAMLLDYLLDARALHRAEICIRPENEASLRVVSKLALRPEGVRPRYVHIGGTWCDHLVFAIDSFEWDGPGAMVARWRDWHADAR